MTGRVDMSGPGAAAVMERLAREQAWCRFLREVRFSLAVWNVDDDVRGECEPVTDWMRRCAHELASIGSTAR